MLRANKVFAEIQKEISRKEAELLNQHYDTISARTVIDEKMIKPILHRMDKHYSEHNLPVEKSNDFAYGWKVGKCFVDSDGQIVRSGNTEYSTTPVLVTLITKKDREEDDKTW